MNMDVTGEVLELLVAGDAPSSENEKLLAASILHSRQSLDAEASKVIEAVSGSDCRGDLWLLVEAMTACSDSTLSKHFVQWTQQFTNIIQSTTDPGMVEGAHRGLSALLSRVSSSNSPGSQQISSHGSSTGDLGAQQLSPLLLFLLGRSSAAAPLQAMALRLVACCLVHFTSSCSQHRPALRKWAATATFDPCLPLSQEGSRVLVLLCYRSNQQWGGMVESVLCGLEWTLQQLHDSARKNPSGGVSGVGPWLDIPLPPAVDPERTAYLIKVLTQLSRTLCYSLLFPPRDHTHHTHVPVQRILAIVSHGLKPAVSGHTLESAVLQATLPTVHSTMWNLLCTLIRTCHTHLLPCSSHITSLLVAAMSSKDFHRCPSLLAAVHRTLGTWVGVSRDCDPSSMVPLLRSLLSSSAHPNLQPSSLKTLGVMVSLVGQLVTPPLASSIVEVPVRGLSPHTPLHQVLPLLELLVVCVGSGNSLLCPSISSTIQLLTEVAHQHGNREVVKFCESVLSNLLHPPLPPQLPALTPPTSSTTTLPASAPTVPTSLLAALTPPTSTTTNLPASAPTIPTSSTISLLAALTPPTSTTTNLPAPTSSTISLLAALTPPTSTTTTLPAPTIPTSTTTTLPAPITLASPTNQSQPNHSNTPHKRLRQVTEGEGNHRNKRSKEVSGNHSNKRSKEVTEGEGNHGNKRSREVTEGEGNHGNKKSREVTEGEGLSPGIQSSPQSSSTDVAIREVGEPSSPREVTGGRESLAVSSPREMAETLLAFSSRTDSSDGEGRSDSEVSGLEYFVADSPIASNSDDDK